MIEKCRINFYGYKKSSSQNEGTPNSMKTTAQQQTQKSKSGGKGDLVVDRFPITKNVKNKCQFVLKH